MEKNRLELRNKKFMSSGYNKIETDPVKRRKVKRTESFMAHRYIEAILSLELGTENANKILEEFEPIGLSDNKLAMLLDKLNFLMKFEDLCQSALTLLVNLTRCNNTSCIILAQSTFFYEIVDLLKIDANLYTENVLMCIGNVILSLDNPQASIINLDIPQHIYNYLTGDYEKPEETLKTSLWCFWCLSYTKNINTQGLSLILSIIPELLQYNELHKELFQLILCLSTQYPLNPDLEKIGFALCELETFNKLFAIYTILIFNNLSGFARLRKFFVNCVKRLIGDDDELNIAAFEFFNKIEGEEFGGDWEMVQLCIDGCKDSELRIKKNASLLLLKIVNGMDQGSIFMRFTIEVLMMFKEILSKSDAETESYLIQICKILLSAGLKERFVESGCLEMISVMYYECKSEVNNEIAQIIKEYFEVNN